MAKIMLVEDDNNLREIYGARLLAEGHEIVAAKDGEEALAIAVKEKPDLIISDVMMPRISGFDMLDILRNAPETKETKVIMMTALSQAEDKARADQLGADRYLVKSQVTLEDVARVVKDVLEGKEDPAEAPAAPVTATPPTSNEPPSAPVAAPEEVMPSMPSPAPVAQPAADDTTSTLPPVSDDSSTATPTNDPVLPAAPTTDEEGTAAQDPTVASVAELPAAEAASQPVREIEPTPVITEPSAPAVTPTATAATPVAIKVELPPEAGSDATVPPSSEPATITPAETAVAEEAPAEFVGPNLMEALEQEEEEAAEANTAQASTPELNSAPTTPEPAIVNGVSELGVIQPSNPLPGAESSPEATSNAPVTPEFASPTAAGASESHPSTSAEASSAAGPVTPLDDEESKKKLVLQPINDPTKGPDLNALLEAEEAKAAVINPGAAAIINPAIEAPTDTTPPPTIKPTTPPATTGNEHDVISL